MISATDIKWINEEFHEYDIYKAVNKITSFDEVRDNLYEIRIQMIADNLFYDEIYVIEDE